MSKIVVELDRNENADVKESDVPALGGYQEPKERSVFVKALMILVAVLVAVFLISAIGGFFYWRHLKTTPQYSLALLVEAAKKEDQKAIDELIDTDVVIDNFVPQIVDKAVELYGRGLAPGILKRITRVATPFMPVVKRRARAELPNLIREKTEKFDKVPFWVMTIGAERYLKFEVDGDKATVTSGNPEQPLHLTMKRNGDKWQIVAFKDEKLAKNIAQKIGQEMIALAKNRGKDTIDNLGRRVGIPNLGDIIDQTEEIFK